MVNKHHDYLCSIYTFGTTIDMGSQVQTKDVIYENIPCDYWKKRNSYAQGPLAVQTDNNSYELSLSWVYTGISMGDIVVIQGITGEFKVDDIVPFYRGGKIDTFQLFLSKTTTGDITE